MDISVQPRGSLQRKDTVEISASQAHRYIGKTFIGQDDKPHVITGVEAGNTDQDEIIWIKFDEGVRGMAYGHTHPIQIV